MKEDNWEWTDINLLKTDNQNPNKMSKNELEALMNNITRFGWNMPIITDENYLIADGEQKLQAAKLMGLPKVPVLKKKLTDTERRIIRQSMNKLRGSHDESLDSEEFKRILEHVEMEDLISLTAINEQEIIRILNQTENVVNPEGAEANKVDKLYHVEIVCPSCGFKFKKNEENMNKEEKTFKN